MNKSPLMKTSLLIFLIVIRLSSPLHAVPAAGFYLPDSVTETTFEYRSVENLIILPAIINDSIQVNLILDTGCRNIVLFGKRFAKVFSGRGVRNVSVTGHGAGKGIDGFIALENKIDIDIVSGKRIPVVVVPGRSIFAGLIEVDGVVGYEIFSKFEVEINFPTHRITFRSGGASNSNLSTFIKIPLTVQDSKPVISASIGFLKARHEQMNLIIDTGSCLALLVSTTAKTNKNQPVKIVGRGFNGIIKGTETSDGQLHFNQYSITDINTSVIRSENHHYASIGTGLLKDYILILNYVKGYAALQLKA
jgi:hypothetical protein